MRWWPCLTEEGQDHFGLAAAHLREMEALFGCDDFVKEVSLLLGGNYLALAGLGVTLVHLEVLAEHVDEFPQRSFVVLKYVSQS